MAIYTGKESPENVLNEVLALVEPITLQTIEQVPSLNPLAEVFEKEMIEAGAEIEDILLLDANIEDYDVEGKTTLKPRKQNVVARYYNNYAHKVFTTTLYHDEIRKIALRPDKVNEYAAAQVAQLVETRDDWLYGVYKNMLKDMYDEYKSGGTGGYTNTKYTLNAGTATTGEELTEIVRNAIDAFMFKNNAFLPWNVKFETEITAEIPTAKEIKQRAYLENIRIIVPYKIWNKLNIGYLANVYNLDKTDLLAKIVKIDTTDGIVYIVDKNGTRRHAQLDKVLEQKNAEGDFTTEFLHVNQMTAVSILKKFAFIDATALV